VQPAVEGIHQGDHGLGGTPYAARESDGAVLWTHADTSKLLGTFQAGPAPAFAGKVGLYLNGSTLQATSGRRTRWRFSGDGGLDGAPIVVGATVFVGSSSGLLIAVDAIAQGPVHACGTPQAMPPTPRASIQQCRQRWQNDRYDDPEPSHRTSLLGPGLIVAQRFRRHAVLSVV
jgi:hypothetical protein